METPDFIIDAIVEIANHEKVKKICEPNIMQPQELQTWMVIRVLKAVELMDDEWERYQNNNG